MANLYSTPSLSWTLRIYNVKGGRQGLERTLVLCVSDCMSPSGPPVSGEVAGRSADLRRVALLHQSLLVVCLAQDHVVL